MCSALTSVLLDSSAVLPACREHLGLLLWERGREGVHLVPQLPSPGAPVRPPHQLLIEVRFCGLLIQRLVPTGGDDREQRR